MTGTDIMDACWQVLKDDEPRQFYPADRQVKWVNEAVEQITQLRPDALIGDGGAGLRTVVELTDLSDTVSISSRWKTAAVSWVLMRCFQCDSEDEGDREQAALHSQMFAEAVMR